VVSQRRGGLGHQPGLADPRLTAHEDQLSSIVLDRFPDRLEALDLRPAAYEGCASARGHRRWTQRSGLDHLSTLTGSNALGDSQI
jgi:hypothetical protein